MRIKQEEEKEQVKLDPWKVCMSMNDGELMESKYNELIGRAVAQW